MLADLYKVPISMLDEMGITSANLIDEAIIWQTYNEVYAVIGYDSYMKTLPNFSKMPRLQYGTRIQAWTHVHIKDKVREVWSTSVDYYKKSVRTATDQALEEGLGVEQTAKRIQDIVNENMGNINRWRARRIAQTELIGARNHGAHDSMIQAKADGARILKRWNTVPGAKNERHNLVPGLDGQLREVEKPFNVQGEALMYPVDPRGSAENTINCRCFISAVEDTGQII
jgi:hypothetical protein